MSTLYIDFKYWTLCLGEYCLPVLSDECASVEMSQCSAVLPYSDTFYPSVLDTEEEAIDYYMDFKDIMYCHADLQYFLCAYLFPECGKDRTPRYVCRDFCHEVQASCGGLYKDQHSKTLDLHCERYPEATSNESGAKLCRTSFTGKQLCTLYKYKFTK